MDGGVLEISQSTWWMIVLAGLGILLTALSASIAFHLLPDIHPSSFQEFVTYAGIVFFAFATGLAIWRLLTVRGAVITITPEGIRDTRVAAEFIPWNAVAGISTWQYRGQRILVLAVDPSVESRLTLTRIARWTRGPNRALGADGLCVTATGLNISYDELRKTCLAQLQSARTAEQRGNNINQASLVTR
jgi:hypothetical protein